VVYLAGGEIGTVDMERGKQPAAGTHGPGELSTGGGSLTGRQVDDRVQGDRPRPGAVGDRERQHRCHGECQRRRVLTGDTDHSGRQVDADYLGVPGGEEPGDVPGATSHVGDRARTSELDESVQQGTVQRLAVELVTELGMVSAGDRVVGSLHTGRHAVLTADTVRLIRPGHAMTVAATSAATQTAVERAMSAADPVVADVGEHGSTGSES
jgi:hypothetical protein